MAQTECDVAKLSVEATDSVDAASLPKEYKLSPELEEMRTSELSELSNHRRRSSASETEESFSIPISGYDHGLCGNIFNALFISPLGTISQQMVSKLNLESEAVIYLLFDGLCGFCLLFKGVDTGLSKYAFKTQKSTIFGNKTYILDP